MRIRLSTLNMGLLLFAVLMVGITIGQGTQLTDTPVHVPGSGISAEPGIRSASTVLTAVDENGRGVASDLKVETKPGSGKVLANIEQILFFVDTQQSIQTARDVAFIYTGASKSVTDVMYTISGADNVSLVGGPSAGAAMTVATIAALEDREPRSNVAMTGTINYDGTIGQVGGVLEKAKAAKTRGISLFLVPIGEGTELQVKPVETCKQQAGFLYCETTYNRTIVNIGDAIGIDVREVSDINEAARLFGL